MEFEIPNTDMLDTEPKLYKKFLWFDSESELSDFIGRDSGEPLRLPPYLLGPTQSKCIQKEAKQLVSQVTEEFCRFLVHAEVARKQAGAQIHELQSSKVHTAKRWVEGQNLVSREKMTMLCP